MAKTTLFKGVVYLSDENYKTLIENGSVVVNGEVHNYDDNLVYVTPKALGGDYYTKEEVEEKLKTVFDNVTYLDNSYGEQNVLYDTEDGITIMQTTRITQGDKTSDISSELTIPLIGSEEIVFDATEDGSHVQAHLDMNITNKLARTLLTPVSRPANTELVAVDNTNSQTMLAIGDGLSVEDGTLKASGTGGNKLYMHCISNKLLKGHFAMKILSSDSTIFTRDTIKQWLYNNGFISNNIYYECSASISYGGDTPNGMYIIDGVYSSDGNSFAGVCSTITRNTETGDFSWSGVSAINLLSDLTSSFTDTVIEL